MHSRQGKLSSRLVHTIMVLSLFLRLKEKHLKLSLRRNPPHHESGCQQGEVGRWYRQQTSSGYSVHEEFKSLVLVPLGEGQHPRLCVSALP